MGFPPNSDLAIHNMTAGSGSLSFEMIAPHGARIFATQTGCRIDFSSEHREHIYAWLKSELQRLETFGSKLEELQECPDCHSKIKMVNNLPIFCTTCRGMGRVTKTTADTYAASKAPVIVTETVSSQAMLAPLATPTMIVGKVQPDTDEEWPAPLPGQEGFIGQLQQR
jgi:hypothetical protein